MFLHLETKWRFGAKSVVFCVQEFSRMHAFQVAFYDFRQESSFLTLLMVGKGLGIFFSSEKGQGVFLTFKKRAGRNFNF